MKDKKKRKEKQVNSEKKEKKQKIENRTRKIIYCRKFMKKKYIDEKIRTWRKRIKGIKEEQEKQITSSRKPKIIQLFSVTYK